MTKAKKKRTDPVETEFDETLARLLQTDPTELAESVAAEVLIQKERANKFIEDARKEIEDGARRRKGRFRL